MAGWALVAATVVGFFVWTRPDPVTFGFDQATLRQRWNEVALTENRPGLIIREFQWTDEEAGVFGFAFSESMSLLGRVDGTPLGEVEELALVGDRARDGEALIVSAMELVVAVTDPQLTGEERTTLLGELTLLGNTPADPDASTSSASTTFRVAADPETGALGIGARPLAADE